MARYVRYVPEAKVDGKFALKNDRRLEREFHGTDVRQNTFFWGWGNRIFLKEEHQETHISLSGLGFE